MTTVPPVWVELVEGLAEQGVLSPRWRAAFLAVPREVFIPEVIWRYAGDDLVPLRRSEEPAEWLHRAYGPRYVVTQVDDGSPAGPGGRGQVATSSASRPDIVALLAHTPSALPLGSADGAWWTGTQPLGTVPMTPLGCCR